MLREQLLYRVEFDQKIMIFTKILIFENFSHFSLHSSSSSSCRCRKVVLAQCITLSHQLRLNTNPLHSSRRSLEIDELSAGHIVDTERNS